MHQTWCNEVFLVIKRRYLLASITLVAGVGILFSNKYWGARREVGPASSEVGNDDLYHAQGGLRATNERLQRYLNPGRDSWQQTERILKTMGLKEGQTIVDVGAAAGYFTYHLSRQVGPRGRVWAIDVEPAAIDFLKRRMKQEKPPFANIKVMQSAPSSVGLPPSTLDWAFLCNAHFFLETGKHKGENQKCLESLVRALRQGGRVAVIETSQDQKHGDVSITRLEAPFLKAGLLRVAVYDFLERNKEHFVIFEKPRNPPTAP